MKMKNITLSVCLVVACAWCFTLVSRANSAEPTAGEFKPVASVEALMHGQLLVFKRIGELTGEAQAPKRDEEIEDLAQVLAELANLNTLKSDKADYRGWAGSLRDSSMELSHVAEHGADGDKLNQLINSIKGTCQSCHDVYQ